MRTGSDELFHYPLLLIFWRNTGCLISSLLTLRDIFDYCIQSGQHSRALSTTTSVMRAVLVILDSV